MKNIKNYLYLYLGCEVEITETGERGKLMDISYPNSVDQIYYGILLEDMDDVVVPYNDDLSQDCRIKPILCPLSDVSNNALLEIANLAFTELVSANDRIYITREFINYHFLGATLSNKTYTQVSEFDISMMPEIVRILLSDNVDLFGLIEAGLAIDKTTIK